MDYQYAVSLITELLSLINSCEGMFENPAILMSNNVFENLKLLVHKRDTVLSDFPSIYGIKIYTHPNLPVNIKFYIQEEEDIKKLCDYLDHWVEPKILSIDLANTSDFVNKQFNIRKEENK